MTQNVQAIFEGGVLRPLEPLNLAENQKVTLTISNGSPAADELAGMPSHFSSRDEWRKAIRSSAASLEPTGTDADWSRESIYAGRGQ